MGCWEVVLVKFVVFVVKLKLLEIFVVVILLFLGDVIKVFFV